MAKGGAGETQQNDEVPGTTDAVEIAMDEERHDPAPDSPARTLLIRQSRLLELQIRRERLLVWTQGLIVALVIAAVLGLGVAIWRASQDRSIVVQAFTAPASLSDRGLTGEAAAMRLLDGLSTIKETVGATSFLATNKIQDGGDSLKIEIPQSGGLTLGDLNTLLVRWFGHQTVISGQVIDEGDGRITLIARSSRRGLSRATGPVGDLDRLFTQLAEAVFTRAEPTNGVQYLEFTGRFDEAYAAALRLARNPALSDLPPGYNIGLLGDQEPDPRRSLELLIQSLRDEPTFMASWTVAGRRRAVLGHDEALLQISRKVLSLREQDQLPRFRGSGVQNMQAEARYFQSLLLGDFRPATEQVPSQRATLLALAHDTTAARSVLSESSLTGVLDPGNAQRIQARIALARGDGDAALISLDWLRTTQADLEAKLSAPGLPVGPVVERKRAAEDLTRLTRDVPLRVQALLLQGRFDDARALAATTPEDCHACVIARGEAASALKDWADADRWFARAKALAPSLPWAHLADGRSRLARGDLAGAEAALKVAQERAPRLAEVRYEQGLLALRRNDPTAAVRAFKAAAERAPQWGRLHLVWGEAEAGRGRSDTARALWTKARGLDLSPTDRDKLNGLLART
jgi:tetratricopeptide (TPR) repeat protein